MLRVILDVGWLRLFLLIGIKGTIHTGVEVRVASLGNFGVFWNSCCCNLCSYIFSGALPAGTESMRPCKLINGFDHKRWQQHNTVVSQLQLKRKKASRAAGQINLQSVEPTCFDSRLLQRSFWRQFRFLDYTESERKHITVTAHTRTERATSAVAVAYGIKPDYSEWRSSQTSDVVRMRKSYMWRDWWVERKFNILKLEYTATVESCYWYRI